MDEFCTYGGLLDIASIVKLAICLEPSLQLGSCSSSVLQREAISIEWGMLFAIGYHIVELLSHSESVGPNVGYRENNMIH